MNTIGMKQSLSLGLVLLCVICSTKQAWGRPMATEELREERLSIVRKIIEDIQQLIYVNDLYEESTGADDINLDTYLNRISDTMKVTDKRKMPGVFSAMRGKRPHTFSAVRGKRPHTFSAVRGKRDPVEPPFFMQGFREMAEDSDKRNAPAGFSFVRGKKDLESVDGMVQENDNQIGNDDEQTNEIHTSGTENINEADSEHEGKESTDFLFRG